MIKAASGERQRRNARILIYGETIFVVLPFIIMFMISSRNNTLNTIWDTPEWSLAATIVFGQTLVRFIAGLIRHRGEKNWQTASLWVILLFVLAVLSSVNYMLQLTGNPSKNMQIVFFFLSLVVFIVFGGIGQRLLDQSNYNEGNSG